jgi:hypothetical protein
MKKLSAALAALILAPSAHAAAQDVAPSVKRKPVATQQSAPQPPRAASAQDYQAALAAAAAQDGGEAALDGGLVRVMSRLLAAGRCGEAVSLATRDGRKGLATRAQQFCK